VSADHAVVPIEACPREYGHTTCEMLNAASHSCVGCCYPSVPGWRALPRQAVPVARRVVVDAWEDSDDIKEVAWVTCPAAEEATS
jgi:hypothetical protein